MELQENTRVPSQNQIFWGAPFPSGGKDRVEALAKGGTPTHSGLATPIRPNEGGGSTGNVATFESQAHPPLWLPTSRTTSSTISRDGRSAYAAGSGVPAYHHYDFSENEQTRKPASPAKGDNTSGQIQ